MAKRQIVVALWAVVLAVSGCETPSSGTRVLGTEAAPPEEAGRATFVVETPDGMGIRPGSVGVTLASAGDPRIELGKWLPMTELETQRLADGHTRHVFALTTTDTQALLRRVRGMREARMGFATGFKPCRTGHIPEDRPLVVRTAFSPKAMPEQAPVGIDMRAVDSQSPDDLLAPCGRP